MTEFSKRVLETIGKIPVGRVTSYGAVAAMAGNPRAARGVGFVLRGLSETSDLPWWRVISRGGRISTSTLTGTAQIQRALLEEEGVVFGEDGATSMEAFGWDPHPGD